MSAFPPSAATDPDLPHDSLVGQIIGICSAMLVLMTLVVGARFWIRLKLTKGGAGADDWCILVAWVLAVAFDLDPINLTKIAILTLYLRLAAQSQIIYRRIIWVCIAFVTLSCLACCVASIFQCTPIRKAWDAARTVPGSCINVNALFFANAALDIFQDAFIYVLPMRMLYYLQVPRRQKIALMIVFAIGGFVVVTGMIRLNSLKVAQNTPDPSCKRRPPVFASLEYDISDALADNNYGAAVWSSIESNIGVVCACLPTFKPLIDRYFPSLMGHSRGHSNITPSEGQASGRRGYARKISQSEFELEHGTGWSDSYTENYHGDNGYSTSATANGSHPFGPKESQEHLKGEEATCKDGGIWKSTSVMVSRS
ncbi:MAG: hypothetical protein Q9201_001099 [Fulgogasparrea decipioides]